MVFLRIIPCIRLLFLSESLLCFLGGFFLAPATGVYKKEIMALCYEGKVGLLRIFMMWLEFSGGLYCLLCLRLLSRPQTAAWGLNGYLSICGIKN
jgi:hypothetical protein